MASVTYWTSCDECKNEDYGRTPGRECSKCKSESVYVVREYDEWEGDLYE